MILKFLILFLVIYNFSELSSSKDIEKTETISNQGLLDIQKKTVKIHKEISRLNYLVKELDLEIYKNRQSQIILKKYISDEEALAEGMILLLQKNYNSNLIGDFFKNFTKNQDELLTNRIIMSYFLKSVKEDINIYLSGLEEEKNLDKELKLKVEKLNFEKEKLNKIKLSLDVELRKKKRLQKNNPKSQVYEKKQIKIKNKVNNINDLVSGVSLPNQKKNKKKGYKKIIFPVIGDIVSNFGQDGQESHYRNGLTFESFKDQYIVSPLNGVIVFAGNFRSYGNLIIIENKEQYHTIISGMDEIMSFSGNEVLVGEPIARNYSNNGIKKKLYFELRYKGEPVDPKREVEIL